MQLAFRKRQERYLGDPNQFLLDFGDTDDVRSFVEGIADVAEEQEDAPARRRKKPRNIRNEQLPEPLPRYEVLLDVPEDKKTCPTHGERKAIGYDFLEMSVGAHNRPVIGA